MKYIIFFIFCAFLSSQDYYFGIGYERQSFKFDKILEKNNIRTIREDKSPVLSFSENLLIIEFLYRAYDNFYSGFQLSYGTIQSNQYTIPVYNIEHHESYSGYGLDLLAGYEIWSYLELNLSVDLAIGLSRYLAEEKKYNVSGLNITKPDQHFGRYRVHSFFNISYGITKNWDIKFSTSLYHYSYDFTDSDKTGGVEQVRTVSKEFLFFDHFKLGLGIRF